jgi:hypothetical protein
VERKRERREGRERRETRRDGRGRERKRRDREEKRGRTRKTETEVTDLFLDIAITRFDGALSVKSTSVDAMQNLALCHAKKARLVARAEEQEECFKKALFAYEKALLVHPTNTDIMVRQGEKRRERERKREREREIEERVRAGESNKETERRVRERGESKEEIEKIACR